MIHWEQQSEKQKDFDKIMFHSFCGIYFTYGQLIFPIAMFTDQTVWRKPIPSCYSLSLYDFPIVDYRYQLIKLKNFPALEFEEKIAENLLAAAYLPLTKCKKSERALIKSKAMQGIATTVKESSKQAVLLSLIEMSLSLDKEEQKEFKKIINTNANYKETKMLQSVEELGREIGMEEGMEKEAQRFILRQLTRKFTSLEDNIKEKIEKLKTDKVEELGEDLMDMTSKDDFKKWLRIK